jgi:hypothetical protein
MKVAKTLGGALLGTALLLGAIERSVAWSMMTGAGMAGDDMIVNVRAVKGGGAKAGGSVNRRTNVNVNQRTNVNVNKRTNVNINANRNVNVVRRPVRVWAPRPYYGAIVGGVALGTIITVSAMGAAPAVPAPNMCWFWADAAQMSGYWDYCQAPY